MNKISLLFKEWNQNELDTKKTMHNKRHKQGWNEHEIGKKSVKIQYENI